MKVLASDYDGTLRVNQEVSETDLKALKKWREAGNAFGIVTGRSFQTITQEIKKYNIGYDFLVCNNGGVIFDHNLELLKMHLIDFEGAMKLLDYVKTIDCDAYVINDGSRRARVVVNEEACKDNIHSDAKEIPIEEILEGKKIAQIVIAFSEQDKANALVAHLNANHSDLIEAFANVDCVDIVPKGVSKATGVAFVVDHYNYNQSHVYTIGDSYNDLCMLEEFKGATLTHAVDEIKSKIPCVVQDVSGYVKVLCEL